jgi:hypothetical protein
MAYSLELRTYPKEDYLSLHIDVIQWEEGKVKGERISTSTEIAVDPDVTPEQLGNFITSCAAAICDVVMHLVYTERVVGHFEVQETKSVRKKDAGVSAG